MSQLALGRESSFAELEAFRNLRVQLVTRLENVNGSKVLAVVSALESEGKSTVSVNLAKALAREGRRVLIFDADFRKPQMRPHFSDPDGPGLESLLKGEANLDQAIKRSPVLDVDILGTRQGLDEAAELAASPRCEETIRAARERYDFVVIDSAPVLAVSEASLIARRADTALLVIRESQTRRDAVLAAKKRLQDMHVNVVGAVLNGASPISGSYDYHGYGYGQSQTRTDPKS